MLVSLRIKNLALVEDIALEFEKGFHAITGETGAGKSILIGALNLTLGERAARDWIRSGTDACTVEAVFECKSMKRLHDLLEALGLEPCQDHQLLLKRTFTSTGTNRQFVNGSPCTLQALGQIGELLVDMHGPHDHQSLLRSEEQLRILDQFAGLMPTRIEYAEFLTQIRELEARKQSLVLDEKEFLHQLDLLSHQVQEIDAARLLPDEETTLETDYRVASNSRKLLDCITRAQAALTEEEGNATEALVQAARAIHDLTLIDPPSAEMESLCAQLTEQIHDLSRDLSQYASRIDLDPERLQALSERITLVQGLKRKYGKSIPDILQFGENARERLRQLQGREAELTKMDSQIESLRSKMEKIGRALRAAREKAIPKLAKLVSKQLLELGFLQSTFSAQLHSCDPTPAGMDVLEFRFAPNPGEPEKPLREIASSGEMSRVMLALKTALADQDEVPVLVFDEVDANVGGEIGNKVGEKMATIGKRHQILCITHLPQVAVHASHHYCVTKDIQKGRTHTRIEKLGTESRAEEVARMLGGKNDTSLKHARQMLRAGA